MNLTIQEEAGDHFAMRELPREDDTILSYWFLGVFSILILLNLRLYHQPLVLTIPQRTVDRILWLIFLSLSLFVGYLLYYGWTHFSNLP